MDQLVRYSVPEIEVQEIQGYICIYNDYIGENYCTLNCIREIQGVRTIRVQASEVPLYHIVIN